MQELNLPFSHEQLEQLKIYSNDILQTANRRLASKLMAGESLSDPFRYFLKVCELKQQEQAAKQPIRRQAAAQHINRGNKRSEEELRVAYAQQRRLNEEEQIKDREANVFGNNVQSSYRTQDFNEKPKLTEEQRIASWQMSLEEAQEKCNKGLANFDKLDVSIRVHLREHWSKIFWKSYHENNKESHV